MRQLSKTVRDDAVLGFTYNQIDVYGVNPKVKDFNAFPDQGLSLRNVSIG
jgi:hypothetical protein